MPNKQATVDIRIGNYVDKADLCEKCLGKLMHMTEAFLNGDEFERSEKL
jgi:hypothetical protein